MTSEGFSNPTHSLILPQTTSGRPQDLAVLCSSAQGSCSLKLPRALEVLLVPQGVTVTGAEPSHPLGWVWKLRSHRAAVPGAPQTLTVGLWDNGIMEIWDYGTMGLWDQPRIPGCFGLERTLKLISLHSCQASLLSSVPHGEGCCSPNSHSKAGMLVLLGLQSLECAG